MLGLPFFILGRAIATAVVENTKMPSEKAHHTFRFVAAPWWLSRVFPVSILLSLAGCVGPEESGGYSRGMDGTAVQRGVVPRQAVMAASTPQMSEVALPASGRLSMRNCIAFGFQRSFGTRIADQNLKIAREAVSRAEAEFNPRLSATVRSTALDSGRKWTQPAASGGISKKFATGTEVELEAGRVASRTGDFRDDYIRGTSSDYAFSIRQPLMRGAGTEVNRTGVQVAELLREQSQATKSAEILEMLRAVESGYYAAAVASLVEKSYQESVRRSEKIVEESLARKAAGVDSKLDVLEAEVLLSLARERAIAASKTYADRVDELWTAMGGQQRGQRPGFSFESIDDGTIPSGVPDAAAEMRRALSLTPTAVLLANEVQRRELEVRRARNQALPVVDLEFSAAPADSGSSRERGHGWEGIALARVTLPWTFRAERAQLEQAKASLERSRISREEAEQRLKARIAELCRAISFGRQRLALATKTLNASTTKWEEQLQRRREGLVTNRDIREAEEDLRAAEIRVLETRLQLLGAWSALGQLNGTIARKHNVLL